MYPIIFAEIEMASVIIGVALIALIAVIVVACIIRYDYKAVLEVLKALGAVIGLIVGTMGTYFFTKGQVQQKNEQIKMVQTALKASENQKVEAGNRLESLVQSIKPAAVSQGRGETVSRLEDVSKDLKVSTLPKTMMAAQPTPTP